MAAFAGAAQAAPLTLSVEHLIVDGHVRQVDAADLDGDGKLELIAVVVKGEGDKAKRSLSIFWNDGKAFATAPNVVVPAPADLCAYDLAELDAQPGAELLELTPAGLRARTFTGRVISTARTVITEATLFSRAPTDELPRLKLVQSLGAHWPRAVLLPGQGSVSVYVQADEGLARRARLEVETRNDIRLPNRDGVGQFTPGLASISATTHFPQVRVVDLNADQRPDVAIVTDDTVRGYLQTEDGFGAEPAVQHTFEARSSKEDNSAAVTLMLADLNADGRADGLVTKSTSKGISSAKTSVLIFYATKDGFADKPDQTIESDGVSVSGVQLGDITGDGQLDLLVPRMKINLFSIIRMLTSSSAKVDFHLHPMGPKKRFSADSTASRDLVFQLSLNENKSDLQAVDMTGDYDGDGHADLAFGVGRDELALYTGGRPNEVFSSEPMAKVTMRAFGHTLPVSLDGSKRSDLVLWYPETEGHEHELSVVRVSR